MYFNHIRALEFPIGLADPGISVGATKQNEAAAFLHTSLGLVATILAECFSRRKGVFWLQSVLLASFSRWLVPKMPAVGDGRGRQET